MASHVTCPKCREYTLHRSRSRNNIEIFLKKILAAKLHRCHHCQWRGWISNRKLRGNKSFLKDFLFYLGVFILSFLVASGLWMIIK